MLAAYFLMGVIAALANTWIMMHQDDAQPVGHFVWQAALMFLAWPVIVFIFWNEGRKKNKPFAA
jgi:hypothetical protein